MRNDFPEEPVPRPKHWQMKLPVFPKRPLDRRSILETYGLPMREALRREWANGVEAIFKEGVGGAARFKSGLGHLGDFANI